MVGIVTLEQLQSTNTLNPPNQGALTSHLKQQGLEFMQFAFRWMNCILMRELPLHCIIRLVG